MWKTRTTRPQRTNWIGGWQRKSCRCDHFNFDDDYLISQINFVISLFPDTSWIVFNSRRTPKSFNEKIEKNTSIEKFIDVTKNFEPLNDYLPKAKFKFVTPDS